MAIVVAHGGQGGTVAGQIMARAGQASLQRKHQKQQLLAQLGQQSAMQQQRIQAQAAMQQRASENAMAQTALRFGLEGELKEQEFDRSIGRIQEQAKAQAQQWEYRYSTQQRQEITRLNAADNRVMNDPSFSDTDRQRWKHAYTASLAGMNPNAFPRHPDKPVYPEGQDVGQFFEENGVLGSRKANGETWQPDWRKTQAGQKAEHEFSAAKETAKLQTAMDKERRETMLKLYSEEVSSGSLGETRPRKPEEVEAILNHIYGTPESRGEPGQQEVMYGAELTREEKQYPPEVGSAIIYMKAMKSKFGSVSDMPEPVKAAWMESYQVVSEFARSQGE